MSYLSFDIGNVLLTQYDDDGFLGVQVDAFGEDESGVVPYEGHSPHGLITRPHDPDEDGQCQVLYAMEAGRGHAWIQSDPRVVPLVPQVEKGGTLLYGGKLKAPGYYNIDGKTGSHIIYVPYDIDDDGVAQKSMSIEINVDEAGEESISIVHGSGAALTIVDSGGDVSIAMKNAAGDSYVEVNDDGIILNGSVTVQGGFNAGGPGGATPLARAAPLILALEALIKVVSGLPGGSGASAISASLAAIAALNTKGA